jgi:hypothetical protein
MGMNELLSIYFLVFCNGQGFTWQWNSEEVTSLGNYVVGWHKRSRFYQASRKSDCASLLADGCSR